MDLTLVAVIAIALFFDFTNGFHDAANAIATSVSTRALSPKLAVALAGVLNFAGAFVSLKVAATVAKGIVTPGSITLTVVLAGVVAAVIWNLITWRLGLPTSSSHALIGGVAGAAMSAAGLGVIQWTGLRDKVLLPSLASPILGIVIAALLASAIVVLVKKRNGARAPHLFRRLQVVTAGLVAFAHGTNDAQKTMGVIALALIAAHPGVKFSVPVWVILSSAAVMAAGTYAGGWRIIHTLGRRITHLEPHQGFAAELTTASLLLATGNLGFPVSTTHTITGSVMGTALAEDRHQTNWGVAGNILIAWLLTIPAAAIVAAGVEHLTRMPNGAMLAGGLAVLAALLALKTRTGLRGLQSATEEVESLPKAA